MPGLLKSNSPVLVEVVSNSDWWQPYVPPLVGLVGSLIVAAAAFAGVVKNNRTNRDAIAAADTRERDKWTADRDREREKWHRDNLLRLCTDALRIAREVQVQYSHAEIACKTAADIDKAQSAFRHHMDAAQDAIDQIIPLHYEIDLLGEAKVAFEFLEFREVAVFVAPAIEQFHQYLVGNFDRLHPGDIEAAPELTVEEMRESLEWRRSYKAAVHLGTAIRDFHAVAQRRISPDAAPEDEPAKREPWPTPEGNADLFYAGAFRRNSIFMQPSPFDWNRGDTADPTPETI